MRIVLTDVSPLHRGAPIRRAATGFDGGEFVVRVLRHQLAAEGFGEQRRRQARLESVACTSL